MSNVTKNLLGAIAGLFASAVLTSNVTAQNVFEQRDIVNAGTVGVISGGVTGTYVRIASDLSNALDSGYDHRVMAVLGKGSIRNIEDLLLLKGIDIAIVQSDVLDFYKAAGVYPNVENKVTYIAKLYEEEVHLLTRTDINNVSELAGKKVNFGTQGSGTFMTAGIVFESLDIDVEVTTDSELIALDKLRNGEIDGLVFVGGKPLNLLSQIGSDEGLQLVSILPDAVEGAYIGSVLTSDDYPNLIAAGGEVPTVAVGAVMAAYNWDPESDRYRKVKGFVDRFFDNIETLKEAPYHPKWQEVDLQEDLPGWNRFGPAADKLATMQ
ncbi:MAG: TAXI family TRAP transporter solute-binding subunit [Pseudomonadota bacterium]